MVELSECTSARKSYVMEDRYFTIPPNLCAMYGSLQALIQVLCSDTMFVSFVKKYQFIIFIINVLSFVSKS